MQVCCTGYLCFSFSSEEKLSGDDDDDDDDGVNGFGGLNSLHSVFSLTSAHVIELCRRFLIIIIIIVTLLFTYKVLF